MLTIYGMYRSRATRNIWLLTELGQPFVHKPVMQAYRLPDPHAPDAPLNTLSPEFLRVSPAGAIPVLDDDGFVLSESIAINFHIANKFGGALGPADPREHSRMLQWAFYGVSAVEETALTIQFAHTKGEAATSAGMAKLADAKEKLRRPFAALDGALRDTGFLVGGSFHHGRRQHGRDGPLRPDGTRLPFRIPRPRRLAEGLSGATGISGHVGETGGGTGVRRIAAIENSHSDV